MDIAPSYEEGHLLVAAVRILQHKDGRSPTPEEVASLLGFSNEKTYVLVHELRQRGILKGLEGPFGIRLDVGDPVPIEELPRGGSGPSIEGELAEFHSRERDKREEMERMFLGGEADRRRRERVQKMEQEFRQFRPKGGGLGGLFKSESGASGPDSEADQEGVGGPGGTPGDERPASGPRSEPEGGSEPDRGRSRPAPGSGGKREAQNKAPRKR